MIIMNGKKWEKNEVLIYSTFPLKLDILYNFSET